MSRGDGTHSSLFWIGIGILIAMGFFMVFYILPRLIAHFFPGVGFVIFLMVVRFPFRRRKPERRCDPFEDIERIDSCRILLVVTVQKHTHPRVFVPYYAVEV